MAQTRLRAWSARSSTYAFKTRRALAHRAPIDPAGPCFTGTARHTRDPLYVVEKTCPHRFRPLTELGPSTPALWPQASRPGTFAHKYCATHELQPGDVQLVHLIALNCMQLFKFPKQVTAVPCAAPTPATQSCCM